jgi:hypothetical protein
MEENPKAIKADEKRHVSQCECVFCELTAYLQVVECEGTPVICAQIWLA